MQTSLASPLITLQGPYHFLLLPKLSFIKKHAMYTLLVGEKNWLGHIYWLVMFICRSEVLSLFGLVKRSWLTQV